MGNIHSIMCTAQSLRDLYKYPQLANSRGNSTCRLPERSLPSSITPIFSIICKNTIITHWVSDNYEECCIHNFPGCSIQFSSPDRAQIAPCQYNPLSPSAGTTRRHRAGFRRKKCQTLGTTLEVFASLIPCAT